MLNRSLTIFVSRLIGYGIRLVLPLFLVRLLPMADFGAYRQFFLLEIFIATLFQFGVNQALYYFIPRDERNAGAYFLNSVALNLLIYTVAFTAIGLGRGPLSTWLNMPILDQAFRYLAAYTVVWVLIASCDCYLTARQKVKATAFFEITGQLLAGALTVAAAYWWRDLHRIILALTAARVLQLAAMLAYIHLRLHGFRAERYLRGLWIQVRYGVVLGLASTVLTVQLRMHQLFVSRYFGTEDFAVYSVGCTDIPIVHYFSQAVAMIALGKFAQMERDGDWQGIRWLWTRVLTSLYAVALPVVAVLLLVSGPLVRLMFTEAYAAAVPIFRFNVLIALGLIFNATLVLRAMDRNDVTIRINLAVLAATPFALYAGMTVAGMTGVIAAQVLLLIGSRLGLLARLNRITGARLPYVVAPRAIGTFYRETWDKATDRLAARLRPAAAGKGGP